MARFDFDPNEYKDEANNFNPIPRGEYRLKAVEAEEFDTKAGDGSLIKVKFEVVDGQFARRKIFQNFNVNNPSEKAQSIGRGQIYAWRVACNKPEVLDTDQLLEVPFIGMVDIEERDGYSPQNRIRRFLDPSDLVKRTEPAGAYDPAKNGKQEGLPLEGGAGAQPRRASGGGRKTEEKKPWDDDIPF